MKIVKQSVELIRVDELPTQLIEGIGRTCFPPEAEVLTDDGWKSVMKIAHNDRVLTYNAAAFKLEYQPANMVKQDFNGDLVCSDHANLKFKVTPDHRMYACKAHHQADDAVAQYKFVTAAGFLERGRNFGFRVPRWFQGNPERQLDTLVPKRVQTEDYHYQSGRGHATKSVVTGRSYPINADFLTILAAYIAKGHIGKPEGSAHYVAITQTIGAPLYQGVVTAATALGIKFHVNPDPRKRYIGTFHLSGGRPFVKFIEDNCGRYSKGKKIPKFIRHLPNVLIEHFLRVLYQGDGSGNTTRTERYLSVSELLVDQVQELHILLGRSATKGFMTSESWLNCDGIFYAEQSQRDSWIIKPTQCYKERYVGPVYCPSTKNGVVCIRFAGKPFWCGNCYKSEDKITDNSADKFVEMLGDRGHFAMIEHAHASFRIVCNRGVSHELVRHRLASYAQECVTGDTVVAGCGSNRWTIRQLFEWSNDPKRSGRLKLIQLRSLNADGVLVPNHITDVWHKGRAPVFQVVTRLGYTLKATANHKFCSPDGVFYRLEELAEGDQVMVNGRPCLLRIDNQELTDVYLSQGVSQSYYERIKREKFCELCAEATENVHHIDENRKNNSAANLIRVCVNCHKKLHNGWHVGLRAHPDKIVSIREVGIKDVYDLGMARPNHNYVADGFVVHNSTRYCNYSKARFGREITVIQPPELSPETVIRWRYGCEEVERVYFELLDLGAKPQVARSVLPICLKTEICITANFREYSTIFGLRLAPAAHPEMRVVAYWMWKHLVEACPAVFERYRKLAEAIERNLL